MPAVLPPGSTRRLAGAWISTGCTNLQYPAPRLYSGHLLGRCAPYELNNSFAPVPSAGRCRRRLVFRPTRHFLAREDPSMSGYRRVSVRSVALVAVVAAGWRLLADQASLPERRAALNKTMKAGNFKETYEGLRKLALDPQNDKMLVGADLDQALNCLQRLGRFDEMDEFRE